MRRSGRMLVNRANLLVAESRLRAAARFRAVGVDLQVDPTAYVDRGVRFDVGGAGRARLVVGPRCRIEGGALLRLAGGAAIEMGPDVLVRSTAVLNVTGRLELRGRNLVSWGSVVHCAQHVVFEEMAGTGESVTVVDGSHFRRDRHDHWYARSATSPVEVGRNAWLASKSTVTKGVSVGEASTVAANSLVVEDVPPEALVMGVPARVVRVGLEPRRGRGAGAKPGH